MSTVTGLKVVNDDYTSCWTNGRRKSGRTDLDELTLTYTVGTTVTPDPTTEAAVKAACGSLPIRQAALGLTSAGAPWVLAPFGTNGIYVFANGVGADADYAKAWAKRQGGGSFGMRVLEVTFDSADVVWCWIGHGATAVADGIGTSPVGVITYLVTSVDVVADITDEF